MHLLRFEPRVFNHPRSGLLNVLDKIGRWQSRDAQNDPDLGGGSSKMRKRS